MVLMIGQILKIFLAKVALKTGKLHKGGEPDINTVAKMILNDWQRGKIPYFCLPPLEKGETNEKGKEKEPETAAEITKINQILKNIPVRSEFKDARPEDGGHDVSDNEDAVDWDQVYAGVLGEETEEFELHPTEIHTSKTLESESVIDDKIKKTRNIPLRNEKVLNKK